MPWRVTFQFPVEIHDGTIQLFRLRNQVMQSPPRKGTGVVGKRFLNIADSPDSDIKNVIVHIAEDFDHGVIYCTLQGCQRPSEDVDDVLEELQILDRDWEHVNPRAHGIGKKQLMEEQIKKEDDDELSQSDTS